MHPEKEQRTMKQKLGKVKQEQINIKKNGL